MSPFVIGGAGGPERTVVRAHRCILAARNSSLLNDSSMKKASAAVATTTSVANTAAPSSSQNQEEVILVNDDIYVRDPSNLRTVIASCYGANGNLPDILSDLTRLDPSWAPPPKYYSEHSDAEDHKRVSSSSSSSSNVCIIGSLNASRNTEVEWTVEAHIAILCAHSEYIRSALTHQGWSTETDESGNKRLVRLDSTLFAHDTVQELVSACYGTSLGVCQQPLESILQLIDGATYLGMKAVSLRCEEALALRINETNLADMMQFAENNAAQSLLLRKRCHASRLHCRLVLLLSSM